jgi:hypothetical protein
MFTILDKQVDLYIYIKQYIGILIEMLYSLNSLCGFGLPRTGPGEVLDVIRKRDLSIDTIVQPPRSSFGSTFKFYLHSSHFVLSLVKQSAGI